MTETTDRNWLKEQDTLSVYRTLMGHQMLLKQARERGETEAVRLAQKQIRLCQRELRRRAGEE